MSPAVLRNSDRIFFTAMTCLAFAVVLVGFAPTFYLKPLFDTPPLKALVHLHATVFTSWLILAVTQAMLIRAKNYRLHRALGMMSVALVVLMVVTGYMVIFGKPRPTEAARAFIFTPMLDLVLFPLFVGLGIRFRRDAMKHKRLMYLATFFTVGAGMRRVLTLLGVASAAHPYLPLIATSVLLLLPLLLYDLTTLRRVHPVTLAGIGVMIARVPLHRALAFTETWQHFANWLTNT